MLIFMYKSQSSHLKGDLGDVGLVKYPLGVILPDMLDRLTFPSILLSYPRSYQASAHVVTGDGFKVNNSPKCSPVTCCDLKISSTLFVSAWDTGSMLSLLL